MDHIQIAYDLFVIAIGFAAISIAGSWAVKAREAYLRDFCIVFGLFTGLLVVTVLKKYLSINVTSYSAETWYLISALYQVINFAVIVAAASFFLGIYQVRSRKAITIVLLGIMAVCLGLIFSPWGAALDANHNIIQFGVGYRIASGGYFACFTFVLVMGYGLVRRVWNTDRKTFVLGLLIFASTGYVESSINISQIQRNSTLFLAAEPDFLFSSISYVLYGIFLIYYFLHYTVPVTVGIDGLSEDFRTKYGITERELEIILKAIQGKSNAEIANELFISLATVKSHMHHIFRKIGVDSRYALLVRVRSAK